MRPFLVSNGYSYILLAVDYVSRWVEAIATRTNDARVVVDFLKSNIFYRFGVPKALISDQGSHFCNRAMASLLQKYGVAHKIATAYHPQTNDQAEVFNREIKKMLQKMTNPNRKDWSRLLEDSLWAHRTAYRASIGISPYRIVFELDELRLEACENSRIYKQKVKKFHDQRILRKYVFVGQKVLLFNSRLKLIVGKLRSRWDGPFVIINIFPHGAVQLKDEHTNNTFQVNGHQLKPFHEGPTSTIDDMEIISLLHLIAQHKPTRLHPSQSTLCIEDNARFKYEGVDHLRPTEQAEFDEIVEAITSILEKGDPCLKGTKPLGPKRSLQVEAKKNHDFTSTSRSRGALELSWE
ncbi:Pol polyprotein, partial [Mucuna pruriens]